MVNTHFIDLLHCSDIPPLTTSTSPDLRVRRNASDILHLRLLIANEASTNRIRPMESESSQPGTPAGGPLRAVTQERVNQQRDSSTSVHDKISQFNNLSIAMQTKQLERKTADAALKRAMLGREEAEVELRKHKEELRALRKAVEEGKERERRVGERLETVMVSWHCAAPWFGGPHHHPARC